MRGALKSAPQAERQPEGRLPFQKNRARNANMDGTMKVAVMNGIGKMGYEEREIPDPQDNEVLVKIEYVGICGSDLHYYEHGAIGEYAVVPPFVLGHECGGTVVAAGKNVRHLKAGDRVALEPGKTCGQCEFCRSGKYNLCPDVVFFATPPVNGVFQEYVVHEAALCFKLPDNVSTLEGALIEPLAVGFHAADLADAKIGQTAVVFGAGCIGLVSLMALKARSVSKVIVVDIVQKRLDKAGMLGADVTVNAKECDPVEEVMRLTGGRGCDIVIEAAGTEITMGQTVDVAKKDGTIVFVGYSTNDKVGISINSALNKELTIRNVFRYRHMYPSAIQAVADKKIKLKDMVTNVFDFGNIQDAMDQCVYNKADIVKAVVKI
jgi:L-iditol 2-dehydrogenase